MFVRVGFGGTEHSADDARGSNSPIVLFNVNPAHSGSAKPLERPALRLDVLHEVEVGRTEVTAHVGDVRPVHVPVAFSSVTTVPLLTIAMTNGSAALRLPPWPTSRGRRLRICVALCCIGSSSGTIGPCASAHSLGVVVAPSQFALHLVHRSALAGCDCVLDLRPERETPWAGTGHAAR